MKQIVMAITGASGAPYARRLAQQIVLADAHLHLVVSPLGRQLLADELEIREITAQAILGQPCAHVTTYRHNDFNAPIASGSFLTHGTIICPCSSNTLAAVAGGIADNLVTRAALVALKEARQLVLVPREMPLSQIEIENMLRVSRAGGLICPACPGFYLHPRTVDDLVDFVVGRVMDLLGLPHQLRVRWPADAAQDNAQAE
jgi:4-hydroxy-3-polyprenylbenzoate decarboxylase